MSFANLKIISQSCTEMARNRDQQDAVDVILAMREQERRYRPRGYLHEASSSSTLPVDASCRTRMCEWCYQTVDYFQLSRHTVHVAMSCLDRFLDTTKGKPFLTKRNLFQLACVTSLYIAIKVHEPVELDISALVQLSRGNYTSKQIQETEDLILTSIKWAVNPPAAKAFLEQFIDLMPQSIPMQSRKAMLDIAVYQSELAVSDYSMSVGCPPSAVAMASLLNAMALTPDLSRKSVSIYLRSLGQATRCSRHMGGVEVAQRMLLGVLTSRNLTATDSPSQKRRLSVSSKTRASGNNVGCSRSPTLVANA